MAHPPQIEVATIDFNVRTEVTDDVEASKPKQRWVRTYFSKWSGQHLTDKTPSAKLSDYVVGFFGTLLGVAALAVIHYRLLVRHDLAFFIASFGATAVLLYGLPLSPLSQPRNVIGGQVISAIVGCTFRIIFYSRGETFVAVALSVCITTFLMQVTKTLHAPAGATAVIAVTTSTAFPWAGFQFILMPVLSGSIVLTFIAVVVNNLVPSRHYPCRWW